MTFFSPTVTKWPGDKEKDPASIEARMQAEKLAYYQWSNGPGDVYAAHRHDYRKIIYVLRGSITFGLPQAGEKYCLEAGDRMDLPAGVVHDAVVGGQGVVCLEGHRERETD